MWVVGSGDVAGDAFFNEVLRAADVGDDAGEAAGLGFEDDVAKGVGAAGEEEDVGAGVGGGEGFSAEQAGVCGVGDEVFEFR